MQTVLKHAVVAQTYFLLLSGLRYFSVLISFALCPIRLLSYGNNCTPESVQIFQFICIKLLFKNYCFVEFQKETNQQKYFSFIKQRNISPVHRHRQTNKIFFTSFQK
jgi:hypothetical protein